MKTIAQEPAPKYSTKVYEKEPKEDFFDDYTTSMYTTPKHDPDVALMGFETIEPIESRHSNISSMFTPQPSKTNNNSLISEPPSRLNKTKGGTTYTTYENDDAQKKFGGAKAISSDQFFGNETSSFERSANLSKFQGSSSISSAEYFGDNANKNASRGMCRVRQTATIQPWEALSWSSISFLFRFERLFRSRFGWRQRKRSTRRHQSGRPIEFVGKWCHVLISR